MANERNSCAANTLCLSTGFYIAAFVGTGTCRSFSQPVADVAVLGTAGNYNFNDKLCVSG